MLAFSHNICICICIRVAAAAEEVIYEVVAEPPESLEQAQQEERRENQAQSPVEPRCLAADARQAPVHILLFQIYDT